MYIRTYTRTYIHTHVRVFVCTHACMYVHMHACIHTRFHSMRPDVIYELEAGRNFDQGVFGRMKTERIRSADAFNLPQQGSSIMYHQCSSDSVSRVRKNTARVTQLKTHRCVQHGCGLRYITSFCTTCEISRNSRLSLQFL